MPLLLQDFRYVIRGLRNSPVFTITAILTLALGIGANVAIFSVLDILLLRELPVPNPNELVLLHSVGSLQDFTIWERAAFEAYRDHNQVFSGVLAFSPGVSEITRYGHTTSAQIDFVSENFFAVLGVRPFAGRLSSTDGVRGSTRSPGVVLSYNYWRSEFQSAPDVIGTPLPLGSSVYTVIGIAPPEFFGVVVGTSPDLYVPLGTTSQQADWVTILARLKSGVSREQAQMRLEPLFQQISERSEIPAVERSQGMARLLLTPAGRGLSDIRDGYRLPLRIAMTFVGLVLLIACSNVANLLLARGISRTREFAVRLALGASRLRLIRQLMTESALLALMGAIIGSFTGRAITSLLVSSLSTERIPVMLTIGLTNRLILFTVAIFGLSVVCCGLVPALSVIRREAVEGLRMQPASYDRFSSRSRVSEALVIFQVALSITVLFCATLLLRSLVNLETLDTGFNRGHVLVVALAGSTTGYSAAQIEHFYNALIDRAKALPGVRGASLSAITPIGGREIGVNVAFEGETQRQSQETHVSLSSVTPGYFQTLGIPLLAGRDFNAHDGTASPRVAIINRTMARHFFGDKNPLGARFRFVEGRRPPMEIVGVASDSKYLDLREKTPDFVYLCRQQAGAPSSIAGVLHVRVEGNRDRELSASLRSLIESLDSSVAIKSIGTLQHQIDESLHEDRLISALGAAFSTMALILTCVGLYGSVSFGVARRNAEIGIRMALGARRSAVLAFVLREVLSLVLAGILLGIPVALAASRLISGMLFGLSANEPSAIALPVVILLVVALLAGYLPARRAARLDPMTALRSE